jgi:ABC-type Mn2+/Zn2+ transport system ATPase subunit
MHGVARFATPITTEEWGNEISMLFSGGLSERAPDFEIAAKSGLLQNSWTGGRELFAVKHQLLNSFQANNFRCFDHVELHDLRRLNIVVGRNASGKTALLEAIRLGLAGTPAALWTMNNARGVIIYLPQPVTREQFEAVWISYFHDLIPDNPIQTECCDSDGRKATLKIYYDPKQAVTVPPQAGQVGAPVNTIIPLIFERTNFVGQQSVLRASLFPQGNVNLENGPELGILSEFNSSTWQSNSQQAAQWFSQLSIQKREAEVVGPVVREFGPLIQNLTVLSPGAFSAVYADVQFLKEKLPLSLISAGISKIVALLSAILSRGHAVILIDEIENGIYYESFQYLWKTTLELAKVHDVQVFASTHSLECLRALLPSLENNEEEVLLLRAERGNGSSRVTPVAGKFIEAALEQGFDVR